MSSSGSESGDSVQDVSQLVTKFADCLKAQLATSRDETAAAAAVDAQARDGVTLFVLYRAILCQWPVAATLG